MKHKYIIPIVIVLGSLTYALFTLRATNAPKVPEVNQVDNSSKSEKNVSITVAIMGSPTPKCKVATDFIIDAKLAYTNLFYQSPVYASSQVKRFINKLPIKSTITFVVPSASINSGFMYYIGFTVYQRKNNKAYEIYKQKYLPVGSNTKFTVNCF